MKRPVIGWQRESSPWAYATVVGDLKNCAGTVYTEYSKTRTGRRWALLKPRSAGAIPPLNSLEPPASLHGLAEQMSNGCARDGVWLRFDELPPRLACSDVRCAHHRPAAHPTTQARRCFGRGTSASSHTSPVTALERGRRPPDGPPVRVSRRRLCTISAFPGPCRIPGFRWLQHGAGRLIAPYIQQFQVLLLPLPPSVPT